MVLEPLTFENMEEGLDLAERSHTESTWQDYAFDRNFLKQNLEKRLNKVNYFTCLCRYNEKIVGYFMADLGQFLFNEASLGIERGFYVLPECRGGEAAYLMYRAYDKWCRDMKAEPLVDIYFADDNERTFQFLKSCGLKECGRVFRGGHHGVR